MKRALLWVINWIYPPAICWRGIHAPTGEERIVIRNVSKRRVEIAGFIERRLICYYCGHQFTDWRTIAGPTALDPELTEEQSAALAAGETLYFEGNSDER